jgi:hypothetical protein
MYLICKLKHVLRSLCMERAAYTQDKHLQSSNKTFKGSQIADARAENIENQSESNVRCESVDQRAITVERVRDKSNPRCER